MVTYSNSGLTSPLGDDGLTSDTLASLGYVRHSEAAHIRREVERMRAASAGRARDEQQHAPPSGGAPALDLARLRGRSGGRDGAPVEPTGEPPL